MALLSVRVLSAVASDVFGICSRGGVATFLSQTSGCFSMACLPRSPHAGNSSISAGPSLNHHVPAKQMTAASLPLAGRRSPDQRHPPPPRQAHC